MPFQQVGDINIYYELKGEGFPLVLIQGFSGNIDWWDPELIDALSANFKVLIFDTRGAGRTVTPPEGNFSIRMFADDTAALMTSLGIAKANILGFSLGGMIAQELALSHSERVNRLVLCGTFFGGSKMIMPGEDVIKVFMDKSGGAEGQFGRTQYFMFSDQYVKNNPDYFIAFRERFMKAPITDLNAKRQFMAGLGALTYDRLQEIAVPVLVMTGTDDILIPADNSRRIAEKISGSKLIEYKDAGHGFISQMRNEVLNDLNMFLIKTG